MSDDKTSTAREVLTDKLQVNVVSIVLGALVIGVFIAVVDTLRAWCAAVMEKGGETEEGVKEQNRYRVAIRRTVSTFVIILLALFLAILVITWARDTNII